MPVVVMIAVGVTVLLAFIAGLLFLTAFLVGWAAAWLIWLVALFAFIGLVFCLPLRFQDLKPRPDPTRSFQGAMARLAGIEQREKTGINPLCKSYVLDHGRRTKTCFVLLHGVSNCPRSMVTLAPILQKSGANVVITRMPENGMADQAENSLARLTAEELRAYADESVDIAAGLGEDIVVLGISAGGTAAAWIAQYRPDVARVVLVAPFMGLAMFDTQINWLLMKLMLILPPISFWKDPIKRAKATNVMPHAMMRQSSRGIGEIMRLCFCVLRAAKTKPYVCGSIGVLLNDDDKAVSNKVTEDLVAEWNLVKPGITITRFAKSDNLPHEVIDPANKGADIAKAYPVLLSLLGVDTPKDFAA